MRSGSINRGFWRDDTSQYFSVVRPAEFEAALAAAEADGSIENWSWNHLLGKCPPPGYDWRGVKTSPLDNEPGQQSETQQA